MNRPWRLLYHRIVETIGGMTIKEMLARMDSAEIAEWQAAFRLRDNPEMFKLKQSPESIKTILSSMVGNKK